MTVKELKTSLREGRRVSDRIKQLQESAERAYANITSATQKISDSGVHSDKMRDAMAEYVAYTEEIYEEITRRSGYDFNIILESWMTPCATLEESLAQEEAWAKIGLDLMRGIRAAHGA